MGAKEAYDEIYNILKETRKEARPDSLLDDFLSEKSFEIHKVLIPELLSL